MAAEALVLDALLVVTLLGYLVWGARVGLSHSAFAIAGVVAGVVAAFFIAPVVSGWVPMPALRAALTLLVAVGMVALGHLVGAGIGGALRRGIERGPLSGLDRVLGGLVATAVAALVASLVAMTVLPLGLPVVSRAIAGSLVLRAIDAATPDPVQAWLAQLRGLVVEEGIPRLADALGGTVPGIPQLDTGSEALNEAAASVVRITGNALACGVAQTGSGFVVADDRVVTNAHVVAGVTEPVVETLAGQALAAIVVYFDPADDLAVLFAPGLDAAPLDLAGALAVGDDAVVQGYPHGGPFVSAPASVAAVGPVSVVDIYGQSSSIREVYTLAAQVREGNSGGPLLTLDGDVAGVVFARGADNPDIGFAMSNGELAPVAEAAATLDEPVASGACTP